MGDDRRPAPAEPLSLELRRLLQAPPELIYRCFTEPEHLARWFGPKDVSCPRASVDPRPGGAYRIEMANPDGSTVVVGGRFVELDPPRLVRMTWRWERGAEGLEGEETLVTLQLEPAPGGTQLTLTHERFASADAQRRHDEGWESTLDCLDAYLRGGAGGSRDDRP